MAEFLTRSTNLKAFHPHGTHRSLEGGIYFMKSIKLFGFLFVLSLLSAPVRAETTLLNVSYDVAREFYKEFNAAFAKYWEGKNGAKVVINQSHGGSTKQARAVIDGLEADVVTMNQVSDIDAIAKIGKQIDSNWRSEFPNNSSPYVSTIVFVVRKGNPKNIKDWSDLVRDGVSVIIPNPKTSGNGRFSYLAAWAYALEQNKGDDSKAREFVTKLFKNVPVLDTGGRGATTTFAQRGIGDVLLTFESEVNLISKDIEGVQVQAVYPPASVEAEAPVAIVDKIVDKKKTREVAKAYLDYLYTPEGQALIAKHYFRPRSAKALAKNAASFPAIRLVNLEQIFGSWDDIQKKHFTDGGAFDQIYSNKL